ncbi:MAG: radical SAM protein [Candidatus Cloacimonadaceae bacterium]|nr:radical SAM protein [Candidatus Cloacimonadaceae bacterium]
MNEPRHLELNSCTICPQDCKADRYQTAGFCGANHEIKINIAMLHHGEEPVISGTRGSGTIFFSHCNLKCVFCQNHTISQRGWGHKVSVHELAGHMLTLQEQGAHNVNLVSPTQYGIQIVDAIGEAKSRGLNIPIVWNSNAYEKPQTLKLLKGLIDIYLPDFKYAHAAYAKKYSGAADYPRYALSAIKEMFDQAGKLHINEIGIATRGVLVRHLVLPKGLSGTREILNLLHDEFGSGISLSLMAQYYPAGKAMEYPELSKGISKMEYDAALETVQVLGFDRVFVQEISCDAGWTPVFEDYEQKV